MGGGGFHHKTVVFTIFCHNFAMHAHFYSLWGSKYCQSETLQNEPNILAEYHTHKKF